MSFYLLDTNTVSLALRGAAPTVARHLATRARNEVGISVITLMELRFGASRPGRARYHEVIDRFVSRMPVYPLTADAARTYGDIRAGLETRGCQIGPLDTMIAAHALSVGATLVTNNVSEFERVPGLPVEDWTRDHTTAERS